MANRLYEWIATLRKKHQESSASHIGIGHSPVYTPEPVPGLTPLPDRGYASISWKILSDAVPDNSNSYSKIDLNYRDVIDKALNEAKEKVKRPASTYSQPTARGNRRKIIT